MTPRTLLSLFDFSGTWSQPYVDAGWQVIRVDAGYDEHVLGTRLIRVVGDNPAVMCIATDFSIEFSAEHLVRWLHSIGVVRVDGILAAPPCDAFTHASARLWKKWDGDGTTGKMLRMVDETLDFIQLQRPAFWAIENPPGRLWNKKGTGLRQDALGPPALSFRQYEFGGWASEDEAGRQYKHTYLWGKFNRLEPRPHPDGPIANEPWKTVDKAGTCGRIQTMGSRNKRERERTPTGFARAFFEANRGAHACEQCGAVGDSVELVTEPYAAEIHGEENEVYLCPACYENNVMDV